LFDLFAAPAADAGPPLAADEDEVPRKERLRWEKELLGLYLSEHPLGDIADQLPEYVTAYTTDLAEESDQAKVTLGGIIQATRRVVTRAGSTMLVATLEDLQGSVEVVVFPKVFADTANAWTDDSVVLVSGRVDHRDEASQLLCEVVHSWDDAVRMGAVAFGAERDRLLGARGRPGTWGGNGAGGGSGPGANGRGGAAAPAEPWQPPVAVPRGAVTPTLADSEPVAVAEPVAFPIPIAVAESSDETSDEPAVPADAVPLPASPEGAGTIAIGFDEDVAMELLLPAIESVTQAILDRPGPLPVVISIPVAGATRQVRLPHRAEWDERLAEAIRQAAGLSLAVELRPAATEP
ncbi:MAG TPA: OB-fold nucleic acid binding domain-containing protein, partial [Candidatus Binatia bacterium]|nr:OB-fold nucleic acid binding domain-containing protein [Candidatus Binatia bacterium]